MAPGFPRPLGSVLRVNWLISRFHPVQEQCSTRLFHDLISKKSALVRKELSDLSAPLRSSPTEDQSFDEKPHRAFGQLADLADKL